MIARVLRLLAVALAAVSAIQVGPGQAQPVPPPPLLPGELLAPLSNCTIVVRLPANLTETREAWLQRYRTFHWRGECRNGLAHGRGILTFTHEGRDYPVEPTEAVYGRFFGVQRYKGVAPGYFRIVYTALDGRSASIDQVADPFKPVWGRPASQSSTDFHSSVYAPGGRWVTAFANICYVLKDQLRDCTGDNYNVYGVMMSDGRSTETTTVWCPDPKTPTGCEALWRQYVDPMRAEIEALQAEVERDTPAWRQRVAALNAPREAQIAALETARVEAAARQQAEREEAAAKADAEFRATLAKGNAGQLFALADRLRESGQTAQARETLRTLVSRFPDHPLAANAAQQLSQMGAAPGGSASASTAAPSYSHPGASTASASAPPAAATGACANGEAEEERLGQLALRSGQKFPGETVRPMESLLWAVGGIIRMYESCPSHPNAAAKLQSYRKVYADTLRTCGQMSSQGACTPRLH